MAGTGDDGDEGSNDRDDDGDGTRPEAGRGAALFWTAWGALAVALGRGAVAFGLDHVVHGVELERARQRLAVLGGEIALHAGLWGVGTWMLLVAARERSRGVRLAAVAVIAAAATGVVTGRTSSDVERLVGVADTRGQAATAAVFVACFVGAWVLGRLAWRPGGRGRFAAALVPIGLLALAPFVWGALYGSLSDTMQVRETVAELLVELDELDGGGGAGGPRVVAARADAPPRVGTLSPSHNPWVDGSGMGALLLPPPAEVELVVPQAADGARLVARAGIDRDAIEERPPELADHGVRFEVLLGGRAAWSRTVPLERPTNVPGSVWYDVAGDEGLFVRPGEMLALRTTLVDPGGEPVEHATAIRCGFGGLTLERRWEAPREPSSPAAPNVVLIVMDTQRADRLGLYGYARDTSPNLDALAARGTVFDAAAATSSWTWPSTASVLTGLSPEEHGVLHTGSSFLPHGVTTLAEVLQREGVTTAAWATNPIVAPDRNFDQGFEWFEARKGGIRDSAEVMPDVLDWLRAAAGKRFFLYLHLSDPHDPQVPRPQDRAALAADVPEDFSPEAIGRFQRDLVRALTSEEFEAEPPTADEVRWMSELYDACVRSGDHWVGQVLDELAALGLEDETIVAFTSDHGEELFDHALATHGHTLFQELVRAPLVVAGPGVPRGERVDRPCSNRHLAPTLARLAGARLDVPGAVDLLDAGAVAASPAVEFSTWRGVWRGRHPLTLRALRRGDLVLHVAQDPADGSLLGAELYDLAADPGERRDLATERPGDVEAMRAELERRLAEARARRPKAADPGGDEEAKRMLKALGYVGDD